MGSCQRLHDLGLRQPTASSRSVGRVFDFVMRYTCRGCGPLCRRAAPFRSLATGMLSGPRSRLLLLALALRPGRHLTVSCPQACPQRRMRDVLGVLKAVASTTLACHGVHKLHRLWALPSLLCEPTKVAARPPCVRSCEDIIIEAR